VLGAILTPLSRDPSKCLVDLEARFLRLNIFTHVSRRALTGLVNERSVYCEQVIQWDNLIHVNWVSNYSLLNGSTHHEHIAG
jgi:hypothetical protein